MRVLALLRVSPVLAVAAACASFQSPGPRASPLTPALRRLYGCYSIGFRFPTGAMREWRIRLDSTAAYDDTARRWATFLTSKAQRQPPMYWEALPADTLLVRTMMGHEGQGVEIRGAVRGDSLAGFALEHWSLGDDAPREMGPVVGARLPCPSSGTPQ